MLTSPAGDHDLGFTIDEANPEITTARDVLVSRGWFRDPGPDGPRIPGGVFHADGTPVDAAVLKRDGDVPPPSAPHHRTIDRNAVTRLKRAVFGGIAHDHFGHFLLESLARCWCADRFPDLPWLFVVDPGTGLRPYQRDLLVLVGLDPSRIVAVEDWHAVDELVIPGASLLYQNRVSRAFARMFERAPVPATAIRNRRVYLSRRAAPFSRVAGEAELETVLRREGWTIVVPEQLPIPEQAALFRQDNVVMGVQGSALHLGVFGRPFQRTVQICRSQHVIYRAYFMLDALFDTDALYLDTMAAHTALPVDPSNGPFLIDLAVTLAALERANLVGPQDPDAIAALAAHAERRFRACWHWKESHLRFFEGRSGDGTPATRESALPHARLAEELGNGDAEFVVHHAGLTLHLQRSDAALELLDADARRGVARGADDRSRLAETRSWILEALGRDDEALDAAREAATFRPTNVDTQHRYASTLYRCGRIEEAYAVLDACDLSRSGHGYVLLTELCRRTGRDAQALAVSFDACRAAPEDAALCRHLAYLLMEHGRHRDARDVLAAWLRHSNGDAEFLAHRFAAERIVAGDAAAFAWLRAAYLESPADPALGAALTRALVEAHAFPDFASGDAAVGEPGQEPLAACIRALEQDRHDGTQVALFCAMAFRSGLAADARLLCETLAAAE